MKVLLLLMLFACRDREHDLVKPAEGSAAKIVATPPKPLGSLEHMTFTLPANWKSSYNADQKTWVFSTDGTAMDVSRFAAALPPTADDYLEMRKRTFDKDTTATLVEKHDVPGGWAMSIDVKSPYAHAPSRKTYILHKTGDSYLDCRAEPVPSDAVRDQAISLCTSATL